MKTTKNKYTKDVYLEFFVNNEKIIRLIFDFHIGANYKDFYLIKYGKISFGETLFGYENYRNNTLANLFVLFRLI